MRHPMNSTSQKTARALAFAACLSFGALPALADSYDFEQAGKAQTPGDGGAIHTEPTHTNKTPTTTSNAAADTPAVEGKARHDDVSDAQQAGQSLGEDAASAAKAVGDTTREVTTTIGHTTRDFFRGIGDGIRKAW